jgi:transposase-like protein
VPATKRPRRYTAKQKQTALELYGTMSVRALSKKLKIPQSTLGNWAARAGIKSGRADQVASANEARRADAIARRQKLAADLLADAEKLRGQLFKPCVVYNFGGKDNTFAKAKLAEPDFRAKQQILTGVGIAVDKVIALERHDSDGNEGMPAVDEWLGAMKGKS